MNDLITVKEAAKILGVHPITIRRWDKNGKLKAARHRFNNYRLYKRSEVEKLAARLIKK
jgi:excisionase family DNA binding protein